MFEEPITILIHGPKAPKTKTILHLSSVIQISEKERSDYNLRTEEHAVTSSTEAETGVENTSNLNTPASFIPSFLFCFSLSSFLKL